MKEWMNLTVCGEFQDLLQLNDTEWMLRHSVPFCYRQICKVPAPTRATTVQLELFSALWHKLSGLRQWAAAETYVYKDVALWKAVETKTHDVGNKFGLVLIKPNEAYSDWHWDRQPVVTFRSGGDMENDGKKGMWIRRNVSKERKKGEKVIN
jgi:hypothetical protein